MVDKGFDARTEKEKRQDRRIWIIVLNELGPEFVPGTSESKVTDYGEYQTDNEEEMEGVGRRLQQGFSHYDDVLARGKDEIKRQFEGFELESVRRKQARYIADKNLGVDIEYWARMPYWTAQEGAAVINGLNPVPLSGGKAEYELKTLVDKWPVFQSYQRVKELAMRAKDVRELPNKTCPADFIYWALCIGLPVSRQLESLVTEIGTMQIFFRQLMETRADRLNSPSNFEPTKLADKPMQRFQAQEAKILHAIINLGENPISLPKFQPGISGIKSEVRKFLADDPLFVSGTVFEKAWERLRASGAIGENC